jgi:hypothetical protein
LLDVHALALTYSIERFDAGQSFTTAHTYDETIFDVVLLDGLDVFDAFTVLFESNIDDIIGTLALLL